MNYALWDEGKKSAWVAKLLENDMAAMERKLPKMGAISPISLMLLLIEKCPIYFFPYIRSAPGSGPPSIPLPTFQGFETQSIV